MPLKPKPTQVPRNRLFYKAKKFQWFEYKEHGVPFTGETRHAIHFLWWKYEWFTGTILVDVSRIRPSSDPGDSARRRLLD